jgi:hypothetical protein
MKPEKRNTREPYKKPKMVIEKIELATVAGQYAQTPVDQLQPMFGLCCPS